MDKASDVAEASPVAANPEVVDYYVNCVLEQHLNAIDQYFEASMKEIDPKVLNSSIYKAGEVLNKIADAEEFGRWKILHDENDLVIPLEEFEYLDPEAQSRHMAKILERFESMKALSQKKTQRHETHLKQFGVTP